LLRWSVDARCRNSRDDSSDEVIAADSRSFIRDWVLQRFPDAAWYDLPRIDLG